MIGVLAKARFVDTLAPQAEWKLVHRLADAALPSVVGALHRAWWGPEDETTWTRVIEALRAGGAERAAAQVNVDALAERLRDDVWPRVFATHLRARDVVRRQARRGVLQKKVLTARERAVQEALSQTNPFAAEWSERNAARLVVQVTAETREAVQVFVTEAFNEQVTVTQLARQLHEVVGLTKAQMLTLSHQRDRWIADGLSGEVIQRRIVVAYAKALRHRTMNIARTEVLNAANSGQVAAWQDARSEGLLDERLVKEFIVTPDDRLCPVCAPLDGEQRKLDEAFSFGGQNPPVHPSCRCAVGMATPRRS